MKRVLVGVSLAVALSASCKDSLGPALSGRWATTGIELIASPSTRELRVACNRPAPLPWSARLDTDGRIQFSGTLGNSIVSYAFTFSGQLRGDTLAATLTSHSPYGPTVTQDFLLTADGDPGWDRLSCVG
jgi:hypothetical protein